MNTNLPLFKGCGVAIITPFSNGKIDFDALEKLIEFQIKEGTNAIITLGTTGEPSTMTDAEKKEVITFTVKTVNKRIPVIAGTGGNNTQKAIDDSNRACDLGADGLLLITPYYNKCTQGGIVKHFKTIADAVSLPIILYNVPSRTGVNILPSTFKQLCGYKNIFAIKEACGNFEQICDTLNVCREENMTFYSGDDGVTYPTMAMGGAGVISVAANIVPAEMAELTQCWFKGNIARATELHFKLLPLIKDLFCEVNPIPVKAAAAMLKFCDGEIRLPLTEIEPQNKQKLLNTMKTFGLKI